jgi:hypothetical protein
VLTVAMSAGVATGIGAAKTVAHFLIRQVNMPCGEEGTDLAGSVGVRTAATGTGSRPARLTENTCGC